MSELDDRLSEGREGVATMDPPADLWARVLERSTNGDAVVHDLTISPQRRRPPLWLAVATVAAVLAVVVALTRLDDDQAVDTVPVTEGHWSRRPLRPSPRSSLTRRRQRRSRTGGWHSTPTDPAVPTSTSSGLARTPAGSRSPDRRRPTRRVPRGRRTARGCRSAA